MSLNDLSKVSQLVATELGLRPGSDSDTCTHRRRRRGNHREKEQQAGHSPSPGRDKEGLKQGKESSTCVARHSVTARSCSFNKLILNALEGISEQRIFC